MNEHSPDRRYDLALQAAVLKALETRVKSAQAEIKLELADLLAREETIPAKLDDRTVAKVSKPKPRAAGRVTNGDALFKWVKDNHPEEIERRLDLDAATLDMLAEMHPDWVTESVRPSYAAHLCDLAKTNGSAFDEKTGEEVPGVEQAEDAESIRVTPDKTAGDLIEEAWQQGRLAELLTAPLALSASDEPLDGAA